MDLDLEDDRLTGKLLGVIVSGNVMSMSFSSPALMPATCSSKPGMKVWEPSFSS